MVSRAESYIKVFMLKMCRIRFACHFQLVSGLLSGHDCVCEKSTQTSHTVDEDEKRTVRMRSIAKMEAQILSRIEKYHTYYTENWELKDIVGTVLNPNCRSNCCLCCRKWRAA